MFLNPNNNL